MSLRICRAGSVAGQELRMKEGLGLGFGPAGFSYTKVWDGPCKSLQKSTGKANATPALGRGPLDRPGAPDSAKGRRWEEVAALDLPGLTKGRC